MIDAPDVTPQATPTFAGAYPREHEESPACSRHHLSLTETESTYDSIFINPSFGPPWRRTSSSPRVRPRPLGPRAPPSLPQSANSLRAQADIASVTRIATYNRLSLSFSGADRRGCKQYSSPCYATASVFSPVYPASECLVAHSCALPISVDHTQTTILQRPDNPKLIPF